MKKLFITITILAFLCSSLPAQAQLSSPAWAKDSGGTLFTSLVSYWKLDETSGTRIDAYSTNNLTDNNTVTSGTGIRGNDAFFASANSESLSVTNTPFNNPGDFSVAFWMRQDSPNSGTLAGSINAAGVGYRIAANQGGLGRLYILIEDTAAAHFQEWRNNSSMQTGALKFAVITRTGNTIATYINGGADEAVRITDGGLVGSMSNAVAFRLGADTSGAGDTIADPYEGYMDEVGFWNKVLSSTEIADLYNGGLGNTLCSGSCSGGKPRRQIIDRFKPEEFRFVLRPTLVKVV